MICGKQHRNTVTRFMQLSLKTLAIGNRRESNTLVQDWEEPNGPEHLQYAVKTTGKKTPVWIYTILVRNTSYWEKKKIMTIPWLRTENCQTVLNLQHVVKTAGKNTLVRFYATLVGNASFWEEKENHGNDLILDCEESKDLDP